MLSEQMKEFAGALLDPLKLAQAGTPNPGRLDIAGAIREMADKVGSLEEEAADLHQAAARHEYGARRLAEQIAGLIAALARIARNDAGGDPAWIARDALLRLDMRLDLKGAIASSAQVIQLPLHSSRRPSVTLDQASGGDAA
jgi:hypothetical protein